HPGDAGDPPAPPLLEGPPREGGGGRGIVHPDAGTKAIAGEGEVLGREGELEVRLRAPPLPFLDPIGIHDGAGPLEAEGGPGPVLPAGGSPEDSPLHLQRARSDPRRRQTPGPKGPRAGPGLDPGPLQVDGGAKEVTGPEEGEGEERQGEEPASRRRRRCEEEQGKDRPPPGGW